MKHYIFFTICAILPLSLFAQNASFQNPYVQLVPEGMKNSAGFVVVKNTLDTPLKIVRASSPRAASVELHTHTMENGVMRMRPVQVIEVPAKGETSFDPNGYH
ncbi:MAG TPA: copper chaperone PCu(A)C, partial [Leptospiraceae bacterium]|nr:copper chaperone PCu(A)C [Leptospiraceae bacterium]